MTTTRVTPSPTTARVTSAGPESRPAAAAVLAAAFADDPVFAWIEPDPTALGRVLGPFFGAFVEAYAPLRATDVAVLDDVAGAALWAPPGTSADLDTEALGQALDLLAPAAQERTAAYIAAFAAVHPHEPAWYLNFLGVAPDHQGRGVGSTLLRAVLDGCDHRGESAYLEATSARNRALYERHGFRCLREISLPEGPTAYAMWRKPIMPPRPPWPRRA